MREISIENFNENTFNLIGKDWMLVTAEKDGKTNMMTASWGGMGVMWFKNVVTLYIRKSRYTKEIIDSEEKFSICILPETMKEKLNYCGKASGRNTDKVAETGLTVEHTDGVSYFSESRLVFVCKKLYAQEMNPSCLNNEKMREMCWPNDDIHTMYIAEIEKIYKK